MAGAPRAAPGAPGPAGPGARPPPPPGPGARPLTPAPAASAARPGPAAVAPRTLAAVRPGAQGVAIRTAPEPDARDVHPPQHVADRIPLARPIHDSIIDEESDARTTAVKARPRTAGRAAGQPPGRIAPPVILPPFRPSSPSISDAESEEVPTVPLQGLPPSALARRGAAGPGQVAPAASMGPQAVPNPGAPRTPNLPSLQSSEEEWAGGRGPLTEDRLFAEADRLALEAVRLGDEAKVSAARAERQAVIAKISGDAAAIAVEAVRIASTLGIGEAARRMEDAYALEATIRRLIAAPLDVLPSVAPRPTSPSKAPPPSSPGLAPPPHELRPSYAPPPSGTPAATPSAWPPAAAPGPMSRRPDSHSMIPPPATPQGTGGFEAFEERLRPTIFGLPSVHVAALAIGTFVLVLILMWILMG